MKKDVKNIKTTDKTDVRASSVKRVLSLVLISSFLLICFLPMVSDGIFFGEKNYFYYPADWDADIFKNNLYMSFDRDLLFTSDGVTQRFSKESDYESASDHCKFFLDYFDTVIRGKYGEISKFYVDGYFSTAPKFTMQMLYEPSVALNSFEDVSIDGESVRVYNFTVIYKIFKNNGTFRRNINSNTAVPQVYQLIQDKTGAMKIYRILDVVYE